MKFRFALMFFVCVALITHCSPSTGLISGSTYYYKDGAKYSKEDEQEDDKNVKKSQKQFNKEITKAEKDAQKRTNKFFKNKQLKGRLPRKKKKTKDEDNKPAPIID